MRKGFIFAILIFLLVGAIFVFANEAALDGFFAGYLVWNKLGNLSKLEDGGDIRYNLTTMKINAKIDVFSNQGLAPYTVLFNAINSSSSVGRIVSYDWDFGDFNSQYPQTDKGIMVGHRFDNPGIYNVTLVVRDDKGNTGFASINIEVLNYPAMSETYYISNSGNDSNDGLSEDTPWRTISKVINESSNIVSGSQILFKRGDIFEYDKEWRLNGLMREGPYYIKIGAYGIGKKPLMKVLNKENNISFTTEGTAEGKGIIIEDLDIEKGMLFASPRYYSSGDPVGFRYPGVQVIIRNLSIDSMGKILFWASSGCVVENTYVDARNHIRHIGFGSYAEGNISSLKIPAMNLFYINNLTVKNAYSHCVYLAGYGKNILMENSELYNCGIQDIQMRRDGFTIHGDFDNVVLRGNNIHHNGYGFGIDEGGYGWYEKFNNVIIEQNKFYDMLYYVSQIDSVHNLVFRNNLVYDNANYDQQAPVMGISATEEDQYTKNLHIVNNVFYNNSGGVFHITEGRISDVYFQNNIVVGNRDYVIDVANSSNLYFSNNLYYGNSGSGFSKNGTTYSNASEWIIAGNDKGSINVDPEFVNPGGHDFHLHQSSPAIDRGENLSLVFEDYDGVTRPQGSGWDIGAYENIPTLKYECNDEIDNDGDGQIDLADLGCSNSVDNDESNCGDGVCEGGETSVACSIDCGNTSSCSSADINGDGIIEIGELVRYISKWKNGSITIRDLIIAITEWKNGC